MMKYIKLILFLLPWLLNIFFLNSNYLCSLKLPFIIPPNCIMILFLISSYILITINMFKIYNVF
ncbi:MAG: hypothetical protein RR404_02760, partial [Bacilli bacterium]